MTQTLLLFTGVSLLIVSATTLLVAVRTLRTARRYVDLAEERLEHLREGQVRLLAHVEEQRRVAGEERKEAEPDVRTRQGAGRSIERAKQELLGQSASRRPLAEIPAAPGRPRTTPPGQPQRASEARHPGLPETRASGSSEVNGQQSRAVRRPHPDDDVRPGGTLRGQARTSGGFPIQMFRVFYDRYLDNYEGYVKLAEKIYHTRTDDERVSGSRAGREWEERLRQVSDGIERTTERLDILEHSNPELASDDRVSRRAGIARSHAQITK